MVVIGFFQNVFNSLGGLLDFVSKPLGELNRDITIEPFASTSIMGLFGIGLVGTLGILLAFHIIRLFIGG